MSHIKKNNILAYVLVFDQFSIIKQTLDFLTNFHEQLELVIIENPSPATGKIGELIHDLGNAGLVKRHYLFDKNITGNAIGVVLKKEYRHINKHGFVLVTDGDLVCEDTHWLDEEVSILSRNPDVFACGVSLDMSNLPASTFPDAVNWIPPDISTHDDYFEARTGAHLLLFPSSNLLKFVDWQQEHDAAFVDSNMHYYCYNQLHKHWARTKAATAYHLTWDLYKDPSHPYTKLKTDKSHQDTWYHQNTAGYTLKEY